MIKFLKSDTAYFKKGVFRSMTANMWLVISIVVGVIILGLAIFMVIFKRKSMQETNYKALFVMGLTWFPLGIATKNYTFSIMGLIFFIIGLVKKDKWKNEKTWSELSSEEKKIKMILLVALSLFLIAGIVVLLLAKSKII